MACKFSGEIILSVLVGRRLAPAAKKHSTVPKNNPDRFLRSVGVRFIWFDKLEFDYFDVSVFCKLSNSLFSISFIASKV